ILLTLLTIFALSAPSLMQAETYKAEAGMSYIIFKTTHFGVNPAYGRFDEFSGALEGDPEAPETLQLSVEAIVEIINNGIEKRDDHLRGPDFFNSKEFPKVTFKSSSVTAVEGEEDKFTVEGEITMLGVTKPITAMFHYYGTGKSMGGDDLAGGEATFTVKRTDFGMNYGVPGIGDEVEIMVSLQGYKQ
ncbi:MAG: YceI family protein, partial [Verrucomicrobiota bacterium]